jgi:hypothetical protein
MDDQVVLGCVIDTSVLLLAFHQVALGRTMCPIRLSIATPIRA